MPYLSKAARALKQLAIAEAAEAVHEYLEAPLATFAKTRRAYAVLSADEARGWRSRRLTYHYIDVDGEARVVVFRDDENAKAAAAELATAGVPLFDLTNLGAFGLRCFTRMPLIDLASDTPEPPYATLAQVARQVRKIAGAVVVNME
jgi:hypothetical protein